MAKWERLFILESIGNIFNFYREGEDVPVGVAQEWFNEIEIGFRLRNILGNGGNGGWKTSL